MAWYMAPLPAVMPIMDSKPRRLMLREFNASRIVDPLRMDPVADARLSSPAVAAAGRPVPPSQPYHSRRLEEYSRHVAGTGDHQVVPGTPQAVRDNQGPAVQRRRDNDRHRQSS